MSNGIKANNQQAEQVNYWDQFFVKKKQKAQTSPQQQNESEGLDSYARGINEEPQVISDSNGSSYVSAKEEISATDEATTSNQTSPVEHTEIKMKSSTQDFSDDSLFEVEIDSSEKEPQESW